MKKTIRLRESDLRRLIKSVIKESEEFDWGAFENPVTEPGNQDILKGLRKKLAYMDAERDPNLDTPHDFNPYFHDEYDKYDDNEYSWEMHDQKPVAMSPGGTWSSIHDIPDDIDTAIGQNNERLYGNEDEIERIGKQARGKWVGGASPDYMEGWTDARLESNESVNRTIRLRESDLHNMVKAAINEVLDNLDDTEKAYWLMRQRQQRPNTKSKTPVNYESEFANQFNNTMPVSNCHQDGVNHGFTSWTPDQGSISGTVTYGVNPASGKFHSETYGKDYTYGSQNIGNNGETGYVRQGANGKIQKFKGQNREVDRNVSWPANAQANRYREMRDKYNQQNPNQQG